MLSGVFWSKTSSSIAWLLLRLQCVCKERCSLFSSKDVTEIKLAY